MMTKMEMMEAAANLYDGGWRAEDRDEMKSMYWLSNDEADGIARELKRIRDSKVVDSDGNEYDWDTVVSCMNDDIREQIHREIAPCSNQEFFDAYVKAHREKFGEEFPSKEM